jgi:hypothetical protein
MTFLMHCQRNTTIGNTTKRIQPINYFNSLDATDGVISNNNLILSYTNRSYSCSSNHEYCLDAVSPTTPISKHYKRQFPDDVSE